MKKILLTKTLIACAVLAGCSTPPPVEVKKEFPDSMYVVAPTTSEALRRMEEKAHNNVQLLDELKNRKPMVATPVVHNQNLDARDNKDIKNITGPHGNFVANDSVSSKDGVMKVQKEKDKDDFVEINKTKILVKKTLDLGPVPLDEKGKPKLIVSEEKIAKLNANIENINWKNSSLNQLLLAISSNSGYTFEIVQESKYNDFNVNYENTNVSSLQMLSDLGKKYSSTFTLVVSHPRQKIVVVYK